MSCFWLPPIVDSWCFPDSGAQVTLINPGLVKALGGNVLSQRATLQIKDAGGHLMNTTGCVFIVTSKKTIFFKENIFLVTTGFGENMFFGKNIFFIIINILFDETRFLVKKIFIGKNAFFGEKCIFWWKYVFLAKMFFFITFFPRWKHVFWWKLFFGERTFFL